MRKGSAIGFVAVLVAAAVVMILAMRAWLAVAPTAADILRPAATLEGTSSRKVRPQDGDSKGKKPAAKAMPDEGGDGPAGNLPDLAEMKDETGQHAQEVKKAMQETND